MKNKRKLIATFLSLIMISSIIITNSFTIVSAIGSPNNVIVESIPNTALNNDQENLTFGRRIKNNIKKISKDLEPKRDYIISGTIGTMAGTLFTDTIKTIINKTYSFITRTFRKISINRAKGFKDLPQAFKQIEDIANDKSEIKIYGQEKAKSQCFNALSGCLQRISDAKDKNVNKRNLRGNVVYMVGPSGVGKTTMAKAIANAILKNAEKSSIFIDSGDITGEQELGKQLFKTVMRYDIGNRRNKNLFGLGDMGIYQKETESPLLDHIIDWPEAVVIIDEYDKMKLKSKTPGKSSDQFSMLGLPISTSGSIDSDGGQDKSADELLKSIAATGKYRVSFDEIDCSKVLFLVTTNETKEELEKNFGINGKTGGGIQRLNVIEFEYLNLDNCKQIVADTIEETKSYLTKQNGYFKIKDIVIDEETSNEMAQYIFTHKDMQGRAKFTLKDAMLNLFSTNLESNQGKTFKINYEGSGKEGVLGTFSKAEIVQA